MTERDALLRGDVVWVEFDPARSREQAGRRPALVVSTDAYHGAIPSLTVVVPVTTRDRALPHHIELAGPSLELTVTSFAMTEQPRSIDRERIVGLAGRADEPTLAAVDVALGRFLIERRPAA